MFEWKIEDMQLRNEYLEKSGYYNKQRQYIFDCENKISRQDKIDFIDLRYEGKLSYILELLDKFNKEKDSLPVDSFGYIKTISLKAWINRNDTKYGTKDYSRMFDSWYHYGKVYFLRCERYIQYGLKNGQYDTHEDYVDEIFHRELFNLKQEEDKYFREHDDYEILKEKLRNRNYDTTFGLGFGFCSDGKIYIIDNEKEKEREISKEEIELILEKDALLKKYEEKLTKQVLKKLKEINK